MYKQVSDGGRMLWYTDGVFWRAGSEEFVGQPRGPIKVRDAALIPERVQEAFYVGDGNRTNDGGEPWDMTDGTSGWVRAPDLRILRGSEGRAAAEAEGLPACVAAKPALPKSSNFDFELDLCMVRSRPLGEVSQ